jgi:EpsI family protein
MRTPVALLFVLLALQAAVFYGMPKETPAELLRPLGALPQQLANWTMVREDVVQPEVQAVLRADETLTRLYANSESVSPTNLFIAFFKSQSSGVAPHSPKNCLPGAGWVATESQIIPIDTTRGKIEANRYVIAKGENRMVVLYWYQSHGRVVASEYAAKLYLMFDAIRHLRSDTAIVRVTTPVTGTIEQAEKTAVALASAVYPQLYGILPH